MTNSNLQQAKKEKDDEFYTRQEDVERELQAYIDYNPEVFKGKTVLLPCDDPEWSAFTRFFVLKFDELGLKGLVSTSYNPGRRAQYFVLEADPKRKGPTTFDHLQAFPLKGDGDFRSPEVTALRDESDFVITNPPFSLFSAFLQWIQEGGQRFAVIGPKNAYTYKDVFPLVLSGKLWPGSRPMSQDMLFSAPKWFNPETLPASSIKVLDGITYRRAPAVWMTNIDHGRRHQPLDCLKMDLARQVLKLNGETYCRYENYDAIEVTTYKAIPSDYQGVMGIPPTALDKICPEQFRIVGATESEGVGFSNGLWDASSGVKQAVCNGRRMFKRIFIQAVK